MRKILPFFMSTLLVIFVASYWVLNYTGNNADLAGRNLLNALKASGWKRVLWAWKANCRPEATKLKQENLTEKL